ncbi:uncharacterized protein LOC119001829 isoform X2 [Sturnira hondurensis]|uniref:uncharacterized protein LOC119001829 isoform X2 n=1 Tax=Sturnira hondurensis TaxID=192404 RepID=UPI0018792C6E|nr:uncharacterized protein LOC119001829 isoform X2 [Sturnira hondurensis]
MLPQGPQEPAPNTWLPDPARGPPCLVAWVWDQCAEQAKRKLREAWEKDLVHRLMEAALLRLHPWCVLPPNLHSHLKNSCAQPPPQDAPLLAKPVLSRDFPVRRAQQAEGRVCAVLVPLACTAATGPAWSHHTAAQREAGCRAVLGRQRPSRGPGKWRSLWSLGCCASGDQEGIAGLVSPLVLQAAGPGQRAGWGLAAQTAAEVLPDLLPRVWVQDSHDRHQRDQGSNHSTSEPRMPCPRPGA